MLRSYLKSNFANCNTLVIWPLSMCDSEAEVETIKQDLFEFGYLPPKSYRIMESDYQKFNMLLGPYMDRIESAMH